MGDSYYEVRSLRYRGKLTTIKLEPEWWELFDGLCRIEGKRASAMLQEIEKGRRSTNRAASVRFYVGKKFAELAFLNASHERVDKSQVGAVGTFTNGQKQFGEDQGFYQRLNALIYL